LIQTIQIKIHNNRLGQIQHVPFQLLPFTSVSANYHIFPSSWMNMYGNVSTANWQRLVTCQQQTHIVENRFAPGKLFMQTDLWYTKLKLLNGNLYWFPNGNVRLC